MSSFRMNTKQAAICAVFGALSFAVRAAQLTIPIGGPFVIDPRGIFVTVGSAFSGPLGGAIIGFLAGIPAKYPICDIPSFAVSGFLVGLLARRYGWVGGFGMLAGYPIAAAIITALGVLPSFEISFMLLLPRLLVTVPVEVVVLFAITRKVKI
ncbi:MAG: hypothetical protein N0A00_02020 [Candidatus Bathyarchaeota archaeon]|nr:hypothetical protein [Candidatus Bathyarchaeota archaeon]